MQRSTAESLRGWGTEFAGATIIGVFLGVLGPFGNFFNGPVWERIPYWVLMTWSGLLVYGGAIRLILARGWSLRRVRLALAALVVVMSAPFAAYSFWVASLIWPVLKTVEGLSPALWYLEGLVATAPQVAVFYWLHSRRMAARSTRAATPAPAGDLLGVRPEDVLCLSMEDHYVRVHTASGSRLVLATLAQAVAALKGAPGLQTHRSWWVAEAAVAEPLADGRNLRLRLVNGVIAPVARSAVAGVRAAGWLDR